MYNVFVCGFLGNEQKNLVFSTKLKGRNIIHNFLCVLCTKNQIIFYDVLTKISYIYKKKLNFYKIRFIMLIYECIMYVHKHTKKKRIP